MGRYGGNKEIYDNYHRRITSTANKTVEQLGKDIERRLLPDYLEGFAAASAQELEHRQHCQKTVGLAEEIATLLKGAVVVHSYKNNSDSTKTIEYDRVQETLDCYGNIEVHGENVTFHLRSVNEDKARQIAKFLGGFVK